MALQTETRARLGGLLALARDAAAFRAVTSALDARRSIVLGEAGAGGRAYLYAALVAEASRTVCVVVPNEDRARRWRAELAAWLGEDRVLAFPDRETMPYELTAPSREHVSSRLLTLWSLARRAEPVAVIASLRALLQHTLSPGDLAARSRALRAGERLSWSEVAEWLFTIGYEPVTEVAEPGTFARRGGILDVFPIADERPVRIELAGDEIETLRRFDPATQRSLEAVGEVAILPARELALERAIEAAEHLAAHGWDQLGYGEATAPWRVFLDRLRGGGYADGMEAFSPLVGARSSLLDHLPARATLVLEETMELELGRDALEGQAEERRDDLAEQGLPVAALPAAYVERARIEAFAREFGSVRLSGEGEAIRVGWVSAPSYAGRLDQFLAMIAGDRTARDAIASPQAPRLAELLAERDVHVSPHDALDEVPAAGSLTLLHVPLAEGFAAADLGVRVFTDAELFGFRKPRHPERRRRRVAFAQALMDLKPGDLVVHEDHGIARFERFVTKEVAGVEREYLELQFAGTDRVSLPTERIDKITRFVGGTPPALSKLGGTDWLKTKKKVKKAVLDIARELLRIYAKREVVPAHQFGRDTPWQIELENSFPYTETPDQVQAIEEVKKDLERARPMDRLIVGDVGFGKTEVALRAAFKAVMDGKQVAVLVPTTVLAQQHFQTFSERLATFPVKVEMLSRFRSPPEQREVVAGIALGEVDIVIGTHRLLQSDVAFKDLGLLIIDEEHRFGVRHKERLKAMRSEVHVLSMTATPIPRTLHMALSGVRDISVIETPPENRQPIETKIVAYADDVVREALLRELDRGGQVYFVHNRVQGIEHVTRRLEHMVPQAKYAIAHGQMDEDRLERVMTEFARGDHDVLVCTTIIESGLDIPNVNTIVVNRAGTFGLAQLYQLRGRVGRSSEKAFAYLLYNKQEQLTQQARARLQALFEASELGAGFKIAMHDLEIRGAGNPLGVEQHGNIAAVGFELYTQLLQEAIEELKGEPLEKRAELPSVTIDLALPTAIPDAYVPSRVRKLELYRRIAGVREIDELRELAAELRDRYGTPPEPVRNLLFGLEVKLRAIAAGVAELRARKGELRIVARRDIRLDERRRIEKAYPKLIVGHRQIRGALPPKSDWRDAVTRVLGELAA